MFRELGEAYTRLDDDPALRVGVLCASGELCWYSNRESKCGFLNDLEVVCKSVDQ